MPTDQTPTWLPWDGLNATPPVPVGAYCFVRTRNGEEHFFRMGTNADWLHTGSDEDVIAYSEAHPPTAFEKPTPTLGRN